jgi:hypothetical protein
MPTNASRDYISAGKTPKGNQTGELSVKHYFILTLLCVFEGWDGVGEINGVSGQTK